MYSIKWQFIVTSLSLLLTALVLLGPLAGSVLAGQEKTAVCHLDDEGNYILITIADPALPTHQAHGDLVVGVDVDENCEPLDSDGDGVADADDNCADVANPGQEDRYGSSAGDACEDLDGDGTLDLNEANFCLSIDGLLLESRGTAVCDSSVTTGQGSNVATANGDGARAYAAVDAFGNPLPGATNRATAIGDNAFAIAAEGNNNRATATGNVAHALAARGDNNSATAEGADAYAAAFTGNNNSATAIGAIANARAGYGDNNSATALGVDAYAIAEDGDNNSATADGLSTFACAGNGDSGETAVNENLCG